MIQGEKRKKKHRKRSCSLEEVTANRVTLYYIRGEHANSTSKLASPGNVAFRAVPGLRAPGRPLPIEVLAIRGIETLVMAMRSQEDKADVQRFGCVALNVVACPPDPPLSQDSGVREPHLLLILQ